ncbi:hypothetical protein [Paraburkholderia atlantica]|uniref:hypothetical protein n=1 Tax=Paraburkholderia atlantica TaxID=2654982 RepID=UPI00161DD470|nr:hypothetical protein [Paraburkholderia atlantica]MBB5509581.1 hypothetical protein [Paraburkholderia atlantica]
MSTPASTIPRRGTPTAIENSAGGKKGGKAKMDVNLLDQLWDELQAANRAAGPWGTERPALANWRRRDALILGTKLWDEARGIQREVG